MVGVEVLVRREVLTRADVLLMRSILASVGELSM